MVIETANSIARELGTSVANIVNKNVVEDAQKVLEFTKAIQSSAAVEVSEMLKTIMQVKREQGCSEVVASDVVVSRGNVSHNSLSDPINLDPTSPTHNIANLDNIPLSRVYKSRKSFFPITIHPTQA